AFRDGMQLIAAEAHRGMRLAGRSEWFFDTDVQLGVTQAEPHTSAHSQGLGLLQFEQADQSPVKPACLWFATRRRGNLHMIQDGVRDHAPTVPPGPAKAATRG